jgi:hypothetical protein
MRSRGDELLTDEPLVLSHITGLMEAGGQVTLGRVEPFQGVAIAAKGKQVLATLVRRDKESAEQLLHRLEAALHRRAITGAVTQEINGEQFGLKRSSVRRRD